MVYECCLGCCLLGDFSLVAVVGWCWFDFEFCCVLGF